MTTAGDPVGVAAFASSRLAADLRLQLILWSMDRTGQAMMFQARARAREIWPVLARAMRELEVLAPNSAAAGADRMARIEDLRDLNDRPAWRPGCAVSRAVVAADGLAQQLLSAADPYAARAERVADLAGAFLSWSWLARTLAEVGQQSAAEQRLAA